MDETARWLIGGGLAAVLAGVGWLVRVSYRLGETLTRIDARLDAHGALHDKHTDTIDAHDDRLRVVEQAWARNSGRWEAS